MGAWYLMRSDHPTGRIWGIKRLDLVDSPVVVTLSTNEAHVRQVHKELTRMHKHHHDPQEIYPELVSAPLSWESVDG